MAHSLEALQRRFGAGYPRWLLALLMLGSMAMVLASTSINVALPAIMQAFSIGRPLVQWLSTGFLAAMTAGLLLAAPVQARWGPKRTLQTGLGVFVLVSALALLADHAWQLILIRIVQGLCAGLVQPLAMVLLFRVYTSGGGRGMALGLYGLGVMVAPTLGPSIGGYLVDHFGWVAVFWLPLPLCLLVLVGAQWLMPDSREENPPRFDLLAFGLLCLALFASLGALAEAQRLGWQASSAWGCAVLAVLGTLGFIARSRLAGDCLVPLQLWRHSAFRHSSWVALALGLGLYGSIYQIPLFLQTVAGYSAGQAGLLLLPTGVLMGIASFAGGWLSDRWATAGLLVAGLLLFALSCVALGMTGAGTSFVLLCGWACVGRMGLGLLLPALSTSSLEQLPAEELALGAGAITFVRQLGGAFGVNLLTGFIEWRYQAGGADVVAEALAFRQSFWLVGFLFLLALIPASRLRSKRTPIH
ncbi:MAG: DHA2 family efflux MFS transporter permease subunit [Pseudomonas sp.]|uniref:DHA2 family efflux MFS transporter permease subunit n=1 Tax=Pseudomonas sp. TaxID=306 RepID=UPI0033981B53